MKKWMVYVLLAAVIPGLAFAQAKKKPAAPKLPNVKRYEFFAGPAGKGGYLLDAFTGAMWNLTVDPAKKEPVLNQIVKKDVNMVKLQQENKALIKEKKELSIQLEKQQKLAESVSTALAKTKADLDSLKKQVAADVDATIREVWSSTFYTNASPQLKGKMDSLMVNNTYTITKQDFEKMQAQVKARMAKGKKQEMEKAILAIIKKYYLFKE